MSFKSKQSDEVNRTRSDQLITIIWFESENRWPQEINAIISLDFMSCNKYTGTFQLELTVLIVIKFIWKSNHAPLLVNQAQITQSVDSILLCSFFAWMTWASCMCLKSWAFVQSFHLSNQISWATTHLSNPVSSCSRSMSPKLYFLGNVSVYCSTPINSLLLIFKPSMSRLLINASDVKWSRVSLQTKLHGVRWQPA